MDVPTIAIIFFFYGLAFFSMGMAITLEVGRGTDQRLRRALRPLAVFGVLHGTHEWLEMFEMLRLLPGYSTAPLAWESVRLALLALSFLSLAAFGASLLSPSERTHRIGLLVPLGLATVWGFGNLVLRGKIGGGSELWDAADVWTRYILAIPSAILASAGLIAQQREFRKAGMARFGRDSLWAAVAFAWYGVVGQVFTRASPLPPSNVINQELFFELFGFPVQLLRAVVAIIGAFFVIRFLRSSEVETKRHIAELQRGRLQEAERREALRGELYGRVVAAQESERTRIGRELHDETGQALTAIGLGLRGASSALGENVEKASNILNKLEGLVALSITELQRLISDLRPSHLDDLGLASALRWYAGEVETRVPLNINVKIEGENIDLPVPVKTGLFRIAQEALTNVAKHADADNAEVRLTFEKDGVQLEIIDDGCGFNIQILSMDLSRPSWGLMGMEERAALFHGRFQVESVEGEGTRIRVTVPYQDIAEEYHDDSSNAG
ncbi:MAG TPA: sensor histidine kinase [Anaerolineales bacterium]|nr:sensor histidine kinase [Anaerolineales bacterium]